MMTSQAPLLGFSRIRTSREALLRKRAERRTAMAEEKMSLLEKRLIGGCNEEIEGKRWIRKVEKGLR